jgi:hypothetical protein
MRPGPRRNTSHLSSFQENTRKKIRGIGSTHVRFEGASKCSNNWFLKYFLFENILK